jgi:hypothetical protein
VNQVLVYIASILFLSGFQSYAQTKLVFDGQASFIGSFSPDNEKDVLLGVRYIPQLDLEIGLDSTKKIDFEVALNISGNSLFHPFDKANNAGDISPYRAWARYTGKQFELRVGLQKIDFGVAKYLRPIQWFNQIDPRDPLSLTNGVYAALGRYYFLNNANIWLWGLYGNEKTRGFDALKTTKKQPEFGGRFQFPTNKGEIGLSYHHRNVNASELFETPDFDKIPEDRFAIDGKWDVTIGLWFELSYTHKYESLGALTDQTYINLGMDYTFGLGNGLNVLAEHLVTSYNAKPFAFDATSHITATTLSYPISMFDNLSSVVYYNHSSEDFTFFLNYLHQFKTLTGYLMGYYNPDIQQGIQQNELVNNFKGPGFRLMLVYNH